jgi:hypothetical protein
MKLLLLLSLLSLLSYSLSFADFKFNLQAKDKECFHDYYPDKTLIVVDVKSEQGEMSLFMRDPSNKKVFEKTSVINMKDSFTTYTGGNYEVCILNGNTFDIKIDFELKSGIAAKDYSVLPKAQDLKPIEQHLLKLEDSSNELKNYITYFNTHQKGYQSLQEGIVMNISYFSIVIIIIMVLFGLIETIVSRHLIISKKLK